MAEQRELASTLMTRYAERAGLTSERPGRRYLWTDAFAVCNYWGLSRTGGDPRYRALALRLIDRVHVTLGRYRNDDARRGWLSGLSEAEGRAHPTAGGLRIGKDLPERAPTAPFDEALEWERDGQYFHYLTKWMQALDLTARETRDVVYNHWAEELVQAAQRGFVSVSSSGKPRMFWKASTDLSRPLVLSMGQHDALDGYITASQIALTRAKLGARDARLAAQPVLAHEIGVFDRILRTQDFTTTDPLGLGGLLTDALRVHELVREGGHVHPHLLERLLDAASLGLELYAAQHEQRLPATRRLAFRELGLAIGLSAVERLFQHAVSTAPTAHSPLLTGPVRERMEGLRAHTPLRPDIVSFWADPRHQQSPTWTEHLDINQVMLATSLAPEGYLEPPSLAA